MRCKYHKNHVRTCCICLCKAPAQTFHVFLVTSVEYCLHAGDMRCSTQNEERISSVCISLPACLSMYHLEYKIQATANKRKAFTKYVIPKIFAHFDEMCY